MSTWPMHPLANLVRDHEISYGIVQPGADDPHGVPIVRVKDVRNGTVDTSIPLRVSHEVSTRHQRTVLHGGELLVTLVGTVGEAAVAPPALEGWNVARAIAVLRPEEVSAHWLQLCMESPAVQAIIRSLLNTTVQETLNLSDLKTLPIPVPPLDVRHGIGEVIGALDDKIAANTRLASAAADLQRAKFQSLVVDEVPIPLSDTAEFVNGKAFTKNASGAGRMVIRIAELNGSPGGSTVYNDINVDDKHLARPGDILFAWSGSLTLHRWYRAEGIVNQHIFKVLPKDDYPTWLVYELLRNKLKDFKAIAADKATTMGHIQRRHLDEPVAMPSSTEISEADGLMQGLWNRTLSAEQENLELANMRDTLLPQLMSGELKVQDAEKVVEAGV